jgi:hypothetical protein
VDPMIWNSLPEIIAVSAGSIALLTGVGAVAVRVSLRPVLEAWSRGNSADRTMELQERRIALLEAEVSALQQEVRSAAEGHVFERQLEPGMPDGPLAVGR